MAPVVPVHHPRIYVVASKRSGPGSHVFCDGSIFREQRCERVYFPETMLYVSLRECARKAKTLETT